MTGQELKEWRTKRGWGRGRLSKETGIGARTVYNYENDVTAVPRRVELMLKAIEDREAATPKKKAKAS